MKEVALDTNIAIKFLNGNLEIIELLKEFDNIFLPIIVCGELLFGAKNSEKRIYNEKKYYEFIHTCSILNTNNLVANEYSEIRKELKDIGNPIPENDIWISALCIVNDISLISSDKHFDKVTRLKLINLE